MTESAEEFIKRKESQFEKEKDKKISMKDIGRKGKWYYTREAGIFMKQDNHPAKVFVFERLKQHSFDGELAYKNPHIGITEYRIGYYMLGKIGKMNGKWVWGQFCPMIPQKDFNKLIKLAKDNGVLLN